jgi:hypothetical protein
MINYQIHDRASKAMSMEVENSTAQVGDDLKGFFFHVPKVRLKA